MDVFIGDVVFLNQQISLHIIHHYNSDNWEHCSETTLKCHGQCLAFLLGKNTSSQGSAVTPASKFLLCSKLPHVCCYQRPYWLLVLSALFKCIFMLFARGCFIEKDQVGKEEVREGERVLLFPRRFELENTVCVCVCVCVNLRLGSPL